MKLPKFFLFSAALLTTATCAHATNYYWDNNSTTAGFGTAGGTWGTSTNWGTDTAGLTAPAVIDTVTTDTINFGTNTAGQGLGAGTIAVSGTTQGFSGMTFGSQSGAIVLSGGTLNLAAATTITVSNASDTISSALVGTSSALTKSGTGTLILSGTNTYGGTTTVTGGVLTFGKTAALYGGTSTNWTAANLTANSGATLAFRVGGTGEFTTGNVTTLLGNLTTNLNNNGLKSGSFIGFDTTNASGGTFTIADSIGDSTGTGGGALGLNKLGTNTLVLSGQNTYTGVTTVSGGTVNVQNNQSSANGGWNILGGTTVNFESGSTVTVASGKSISLPGSGTLNTALNVNGTVLNNGSFSASARVGANINSGGDWTQNGSFTLGIGGSTTSSMSFAVNAGGKFTYAGSTAIALTPSSNSSGSPSLNINAGTFVTSKGFVGGASSGGGSANINLFNAGTIRLSADIASLATNGTTFNFKLGTGGGVIDTNGFSTTMSRDIANVSGQTGSLTKMGAGDLTLSGASTYTGATNVYGGTLNLTGSLTSAINVGDGISQTGTLTGSGSTTGNITFNAGSSILLSSAAPGASVQGANVNFAGATDIFVTAVPTNGAMSLEVIRFTGAATNTGNLTTTLTNYRSGAAFDTGTAGVIKFNYTAYSDIWNGAATDTWDLGTTANWTGSADSKFYSGDSVTFDGAAPKVVNLSGDLAPSSVTVTNTAQTTFQGGGSIVGASSLTKSGAGILVIGTTNTYSGGTNINGGTISVSNLANSLGSNATVNIGFTTTAGTLLYTGTGENSTRAINLAGTTGGATLDQSGASGLLKFTSAFTTTGVGAKNLTLQGSTAAIGEIAGGIINGAGTVSVIKAGTGTWTLSGNNSYAGTTVNDGTLKVTQGNTSASANLILGNSGTTTNAFTMTGGSWTNGNQVQLGNVADATLAGDSIMNLNGGTFTVTAGANSIINVAVRRDGVLNINGADVSAGTIQAWWQTTTTVGSTATLNLDGGSLSTSSIKQIVAGGATMRTFTANLNGGLLKASAAGTILDSSLTRVNVRDNGAKIDTNGVATTVAAALQHSNIGGDNATDGGLTKLGAGTLTLSGTNTYTGTTTVTSGTLIITGNSSAVTGAVAVTGGSLYVNGQLGGNVTVASGAAIGGNGTIGTLALNGTSILDLANLTSANDLTANSISFASTGFGVDNLLLNGAAIDWSTVADGTYTLLNGTLNSANLDNFGESQAYDIDGVSGSRAAYFQSGSLQLVVVPEPTSALLVSLGALALLRRRR